MNCYLLKTIGEAVKLLKGKLLQVVNMRHAVQQTKVDKPSSKLPMLAIFFRHL